MRPFPKIPTKKILTTSLLLFTLLFATGLLLSQHKPLWNDELFTQTCGIEKLSSRQILLGGIREGNNYPLFYFLQKNFTGLMHYHFPGSWDGTEWEVAELRSQIILRILPILFMSLALTFLFAYFGMTFGLTAGLYALGLALATPTVWLFWAEARPYSLWFLLTTIQTCLLLRYLNDPKHPGILGWMIPTNILLTLTVAFGVMQIAVTGFVLFLSGERRLRSHLYTTILPIALGAIYFLGPKIQFSLPAIGPVLLRNVPGDRLLIVLAALIVAGISYTQTRRSRREATHFIHSQFFSFVFVLGLISTEILVFYKFFQFPKPGSFDLTERHFIYLAPVGIITATVFFHDILKITKNQPWLKVNILIIAFGLLATGLMETAATVLELRIFH